MLDAALGIAKSLVKQKIGGANAQYVDLAERLYGRVTGSVGDAVPGRVQPGPRHWLQAARGRPDPMMNVFWYCRMPGLNGGPAGLPWEYVEEVTLPYVEFDQVSNYRAGKSYHYPNHHTINTLQIKMYEDHNGLTHQYLKLWQSLILDSETGLYNTPSKYKKDIEVTVLDAEMKTAMFYFYRGCWPQTVDNTVMTSGQTERITPTVTFSVDEMTMKFGKFTEAQIPSVVDNIGKDFPASLFKLPTVFPTVFQDAVGKLFR